MTTLLLVTCVCFCVKTISSVKLINALGMEQNDRFGLQKLPAIYMGVEKVNDIYNNTFRINLLRTTFGEACSPNEKAVAFADVYYNNKIDVSFGPGCSSTVEPVGRMAASWNILMMITTGTDLMFDNQDDFPTLIRTSISNNKFAIFYLKFYALFSWTDIAVIYDQDAIYCPFWRDAIEQVLATNGISVTVFKMRSIATGLLEFEKTLKDASKMSRVFTVCCHMDNFRLLMIAAYHLGMTNGEYVFLMCTRYNGDFFGNYTWYRGDENDEIARNAWNAVFMVKLTRANNTEFLQFEQELRDRALTDYNHDYGLEPSPHVTFYYDLILIYGTILNETLAEEGNYSDGRYMKSKINNRTFAGIGGPIAFDSIGALEPDYTLYDVDPISGNFRAVGNYYGVTQTFTLSNVPIQWPANKGPPPNKPYCGYQNENIACISKELNVFVVVACSLLGVLVIVLVIVLVAYRRIRREAELNNQWWRIKPEDISFNTTGIGSLASRSRKSRLSLLKSTDDISSLKDGTFRNDRCGMYKGRVVLLKKTRRDNLDLSRQNLIELKQIGDIQHQNLVKFIGLYQSKKSIYNVSDYTNRGSLQDIVQNTSINLDWDFKAALLTDLTNGMTFLHDSLISVHGRLNSERCVIDSRFVLKISGFGLSFLHGDPLKSIKNELEYLWFAPEVLREQCTVSQAADVYSFAMIMFEILTRQLPFEADQDLLTVQDIVSKVKEGATNEQFRPQISSEISNPKMLQLIEDCWAESLFKRPTFKQIKHQLKQLTGISSKHNILDSLIRRMEQYANNLEDLVSQRTEAFLEEKKKSEELLDQVLPRSVATKLKNGYPVDAEAFQCVTIYFSDIVGFTGISAKSSAIEVVDLLNDLYTMFDTIIDRFNVYKVETIGDAYMVVSGLPVRNGNEHAKEIAQMSLAILRDIVNLKMRHLPNVRLEARIGLHSGPVCAGVVGRKMPRYCLFGDTVNTASRMESHGQAMKIHVSPEANLLLDTFGIFNLVPRGNIMIKGKGEMTTYWLIEDSSTENVNKGQQ